MNTWLVSIYLLVWNPLCFGSIRWCVWSVRPSSPLRLPHLKCLLCCYVCECCWVARICSVNESLQESAASMEAWIRVLCGAVLQLGVSGVVWKEHMEGMKLQKSSRSGGSSWEFGSSSSRRYLMKVVGGYSVYAVRCWIARRL